MNESPSEKWIILVALVLLLALAGKQDPGPNPPGPIPDGVSAESHKELASGVADALDAYAASDANERDSLDSLINGIDDAVTGAYEPLFVELQKAAGTGEEWDEQAAREAARRMAGGFRSL